MDIKELRSLREGKGWTRKQLAEKLAVSVSTVQSWEQGNKIPRPVTIQAIEKLFSQTEPYSTLNKFFGVALNMKPNIIITILYINKGELDSFIENIDGLKKENNLNGYSLFNVQTVDLEPKELFINNEIRFSQIKDIEITKVVGKSFSLGQIKNSQLRVKLDENKIKF